MHGFEVGTKITQIGADTIVGSSQWFDDAGTRHERHHVLTIRNGQIADMQVCGSWREAKRFAKRRAFGKLPGLDSNQQPSG